MRLKEAWSWFKNNLGPAFVFFEAGMHVYLVIYLSYHWTNILVWGFTVFELSMFIYLLVKRHYQKTHHKKWP